MKCRLIRLIEGRDEGCPSISHNFANTKRKMYYLTSPGNDVVHWHLFPPLNSNTHAVSSVSSSPSRTKMNFLRARNIQKPRNCMLNCSRHNTAPKRTNQQITAVRVDGWMDGWMEVGTNERANARSHTGGSRPTTTLNAERHPRRRLFYRMNEHKLQLSKTVNLRWYRGGREPSVA